MDPQIEVISGARSWRFPLEADRTTVGKAEENELVLVEGAVAALAERHDAPRRRPSASSATRIRSRYAVARG